MIFRRRMVGGWEKGAMGLKDGPRRVIRMIPVSQRCTYRQAPRGAAVSGSWGRPGANKLLRLLGINDSLLGLNKPINFLDFP